MNQNSFKTVFDRPVTIVFIVVLTLFLIVSVAIREAVAQEPVPWLRAHPVWESVDGWDWPQEATLHLTIEDPNTEVSPDLEMVMPGEVDETGSVWFEFNGVYDLKPGDEVTMTDGTTTRRLTVSVLSIEAVDLELDTAAGVVEPGATVRLPFYDDALMVTASATGEWFADFSEVGFDLKPGTMVIAENFEDDGDMTSFEWYIPNPRLTVSITDDWFRVEEFPQDAPSRYPFMHPGVVIYCGKKAA